MSISETTHPLEKCFKKFGPQHGEYVVLVQVARLGARDTNSYIFDPRTHCVTAIEDKVFDENIAELEELARSRDNTNDRTKHRQVDQKTHLMHVNKYVPYSNETVIGDILVIVRSLDTSNIVWVLKRAYKRRSAIWQAVFGG